MESRVNKIVVAYSGGLDTSVMIHWLKEQTGAEIIAYTADVGQKEELDGLEEKALATGASAFYVADLTQDFVENYVITALKGGCVYEGEYLLGTSLARPVIAKKHVEIALECGADAVAHGATGKGNDQVRFELAYQALAPQLSILAPWRTWPFKSRSDLIAYAKKHEIPVIASASKPYSMDRNLMHISYEGGILEDPWQEAPENLYQWTQHPEKAPDNPTYVEVSFEAGVPVAIDGQKLDAVRILELTNEKAAVHGIGRIDIVESRFVGMKSRGVYETPGMTLLHKAHRALESITLDREVIQLRDGLSPKMSQMIYNGFWFSPEFKIMQNLTDEVQKPVTGDVKLKLYKGQVSVLGRRSPNSLYSEALATFEEEDVYDQKDAEGFIRLQALRLKLGNHALASL